MDVIGRLDPATGNVVEYPIPRAENTMREFFLDEQGRMWFGSPANDRVGIFLSGEVRAAADVHSIEWPLRVRNARVVPRRRGPYAVSSPHGR